MLQLLVTVVLHGLRQMQAAMVQGEPCELKWLQRISIHFNQQMTFLSTKKSPCSKREQGDRIETA